MTTCTLGQRFIFNNLSTSATIGSITVELSTGTVLTSLSQNQGVRFEVVSTGSNTASAWLQIGNNLEVLTAIQTTLQVLGSNSTINVLSSPLAIPAGTWEVLASVDFNFQTVTSAGILNLIGSVSTTSATSASTFYPSSNTLKQATTATGNIASQNSDYTTLIAYTISLTSTANFYLTGQLVPGFSSGQIACIGFLTAKRIS